MKDKKKEINYYNKKDKRYWKNNKEKRQHNSCCLFLLPSFIHDRIEFEKKLIKLFSRIDAGGSSFLFVEPYAESFVSADFEHY